MRGIILSYHRIAKPELDPWGLRVSPENFAQQLSVLREIGVPMSLPRFVAEYQSEKGDSKESAIVITFDDGYVDNFSHALPLLKSHEIPATIFVSTAYTGQAYFWWEALENIILRPNRLPQQLCLKLENALLEWTLGDTAIYSNEKYHADCLFCKWRGVPRSRMRLYHEVYEALWALDHSHRLELVDEIISWSGVNPELLQDSRPMTMKEISEIGNEALITIGAHSVNHLPLDEIPALQHASEILDSRQYLESVLNQPVTTFAYPHGKYSEESSNVLRNNGFICACTTVEEPVMPSTDPMLMPRLAVSNCELDEFRTKVFDCLQSVSVA